MKISAVFCKLHILTKGIFIDNLIFTHSTQKNTAMLFSRIGRLKDTNETTYSVQISTI